MKTFAAIVFEESRGADQRIIYEAPSISVPDIRAAFYQVWHNIGYKERSVTDLDASIAEIGRYDGCAESLTYFDDSWGIIISHSVADCKAALEASAKFPDFIGWTPTDTF